MQQVCSFGYAKAAVACYNIVINPEERGEMPAN